MELKFVTYGLEECEMDILMWCEAAGFSLFRENDLKYFFSVWWLKSDCHLLAVFNFCMLTGAHLCFFFFFFSQSFQHLRDRQVVIKCFHAWRDHITCKRAAARQQQPQKALGASEVAQQRHASAILAASFHKVRMGQGMYKCLKCTPVWNLGMWILVFCLQFILTMWFLLQWKKAVAKQSQKQAAQSESYSYTQSSSVDFSGIGRLATMTTSAQHQLTEGYMKEAEQACR